MEFRTLRADEIECRVAQVSEKGASLLLYKNARCDMSLLDETIGIANWQRKHYELKGNIYCSVGIKASSIAGGGNGSDEWVWKDDAGAESQAEAVKGEASDSFKRACFNWGLGRELYTAPFIWIAASKMNIIKTEWQGKPKYKTYDKFIVTNIHYNDNREIDGLAIKNDKSGDVVYYMAPKA